MIFGWLIRRSYLYRALEDVLDREREAHKATKAERDDLLLSYRQMCEYAAVSEGKPRFSVVKPVERKEPAPPRHLSYTQVQEEYRKNAEERFSAFLDAHPEEKAKLQ